MTTTMRAMRQEVLGGPEVLREVVTDGKLRPVIAATFPLSDAAKAHELGEKRHVAGKLVLTMDVPR
jgi:NADPH:quinone reductase-like Zn-dependent oxidoreductase